MIVYKATNKINGMSYIGQTIFTLNERKVKHERKDDKSYFQLSIEKYGRDNFEWEVLCGCCDSNEMNEKEMFYIKYYNTIRPNGYNLTKGGEGSFWTGENNPAKLEHVRRKISEKLKNRKRDDLAERNRQNAGKTYEELYGEDRANEIRNKKSKQRKGKLWIKWDDSMKQKSREQKSLYEYTLIDSNGVVYKEISLRHLCEKYKLNRQSMQRIMNTGKNCKGWLITRELL